MKLIFLDIDGVLNSETYYVRRHDKFVRTGVMDDDWLDEDCLKRIIHVCEKTGAKLIISSTWRMDDLKSTIEKFSEYKSFNQLIPYIIGITPRCESRHRGEEINLLFERWEKAVEIGLIAQEYKNVKVKDFVILDDDDDMLPHQKEHYFIQTSWIDGLTEKEAKIIIKRFNDDKR